MRRVKNWQRYLAAFMAAMMMFSCLNVTAFAAEGTGSQDEDKWTVTTAELVAAGLAEEYSDVKALIELATAGAVDPGTVHTAVLPTDELVSAEILDGATTAEITAEAADGWMPVSVEVFRVGVQDQWWDEQPLNEAGGVYTATVAVPKDDAFKVEVSYKLSVTVDAAEETCLLNLAAKLAEATERMEQAVVASEELSALTDAFNLIMSMPSMARPEGIDTKIEVMNEKIAALTELVGEYNDSFKTKFPWDKGEAVESAANEIYDKVQDLYDYLGEEPEGMLAALPGVLESFSNDQGNGCLDVIAAWDEGFWTGYDPGFVVSDDYRNAALDAMVAGLAGASVAVPAAKGTYAVADEVVTYTQGVATVNMTVNGSIGFEKVNFGAHKSVETKALVPLTASFVVAENAAEAAVKERVAAVADSMVGQWGSKYNDEYYTAGDPVKVADGSWTVAYTPKTYSVTFGSDAQNYPYGTQVMLSRHIDAEKAYVYTVGAETVKQGATLTVAGDVVISRVEKNAESEYSVLNVLSKDAQYALTEVQKAVFSSPAVKSETVVYSKPAAVVTVEVNDGNTAYVVTAPEDEGWFPVAIQVMNDQAVADVVVSGTAGAWELPADAEFTHVNVTYAKVVAAEAADYLKLPAELKTNVDEQKNLLDDAKKVYGYLTPDVMEVLKYDQLSALKMMLGKSAQASVNELLNYGWNSSEDEPLVYSYMKAADAEDVQWSLGTCIDKSYFAGIKEQVALFANNLRPIVDDANFVTLLDTAGYADKQQDIEELCVEMENLRDSFTEMDARFDQSSGAFAALVDVIGDAEAADMKYDGEDKGVRAYATVMGSAPGYEPTVILVSVEQINGEYESLSETLIGDVSENTIDALIAQMKAELMPVGAEEYYTVSESVENQMVYSRKAYTVEVVDEDGIEIDSAEFKYGDKLSMAIPKEVSDSKVYYRYYLDGVEVVDPSGNFWFDLTDFGTDGVITIVRKTINKAVEKYEKFVSGLNDAVSGMDAAVVSVETNGVKSLVMQLSAENLDMDAVTESLATAFISLSYDYIGVDVGAKGRAAFKAYDETSEMTKLDPQAMVDMMLNSGLTNGTLMSAINADGSINHMKLDGKNVGAKLMESKLYIGNSSNEYDSVNFYVTLVGADQAKMKSLREMLEKTDGFVEFGLMNGALSVEATIPQSVFNAYLAVLVLIDRYDWDTITDLDMKAEVKNFIEILDGNELTAKNVQTLLADYVDLSDYTFLIDRVLSALQNADPESLPGTFTPDSWSATAEYDIKDRMKEMLGDMDMSELFKNTVLSVPVTMGITNYGDLANVEAVVMTLPTEANMEAVMGSFEYTDDVAAVLAATGAPVYVMLLQDYEGDLAVNRTAVLDLNGMTVNGDIKANSQLTVVSRVLGSDNAGAVTGAVSGNVTLTAGTYTADVSAFVKNGYELVDGTVVNDYYSIVDDGNTMTVTLDLEAVMAQADQGNLQALLLDVMSDVLMNVEVYAAIKIDGHTVYDLNLDLADILNDANNRDFRALAQTMLDQVDPAAVKELMKEIASDLTDVETLKKAIKEGATLGTYVMETANWKVLPKLDGDKTTVTVSAGSTKTKTIVVAAEPLNDAQKNTVSKLYSAITDLVDINNREFALGSLAIDEEYNIHWDGAVAKADVTIDLTTDDGMASDYVTMLALILANNAPKAEKAAFVADILYYYNNEWSGNLEARFDALTVGDLVNALDALHTGEGETDINFKATDLKSLKELIADLAAVVGDTDGMYLQEVFTTNMALAPAEAKREGQSVNFADLEKIAELEDIYDVVLAMVVKMAEGINYAANGNTAAVPGEKLDDEAAAAQAKLKTFLGQHLSKLNGESVSEKLSYRAAELKVTLKLFDDKYVSAVEQAVEMIKALPAALPEEITDLNALYELVVELAKIDALLDSMSDGAKELVNAQCGDDYAKLEAVREYVKNHGSELNEYIDQMIENLPEEILTIGDDLAYVHRDPAKYAEDKAEVADIRAVYESIKEYAGENDLDISTANLEYAEAYFAYWDVVLNDVIDMINAANDMDSDNESKLNALFEAKAAYDALGPNAQAYVDAMTEKVLEAAIDEFDISNMLWVSEIEAQTYTGTAIKPEIRVYEGTTLLQEKVDYTISYKNNTKVFEQADFEDYRDAYDTAKDEFEAKSAVYEAAEDNYEAKKAAYDEAKAEYNEDRKSADKKAAMSTASKEMSAAKTEMSKAKSAMTKAQSALTKAEKALAAKAPAVIVTFKKNYTGQAYRYFAINPVDLATANSEGSSLTVDAICVADGTKVSAIKPVVMLNGKKISTSEYEMWVSEYIDPELYPGGAGSEPLGKNDKLSAETEYIVTVAAKENGNFTGYYNAKIDIASYLMSKATIGKIAAQDYADWVKWAEQNPELKDAEGNVRVMPDREFAYSTDNEPAVMHNDEISVTIKVGKQTLPLVKGIHYTVEYDNNTGAGTATVKIVGTGKALTKDVFTDEYVAYAMMYGEEALDAISTYSFVGTKTATFKINGIKLTSNMLKITDGKNFADKIYTGSEIELIAYDQYGVGTPGEYKMVNGDTTLTEGKDYIVTYSKNVNKGTATVTFTGMGNYTGAVKKTFKIVAADFNGPTTYTQFETVVADAVYGKSGAKAEVVVMRGNTVLVEGKDYTLSYKNNKNTVSAEEINEAKTAYATALFNYAEATKDPNTTAAELKVLKAAETAAYKELQKMPTVTITGKGNYSGKMTETFAINPADFSEMIGTAKDVLYKDKAGNFKTTFTIADASGKKLSSSDYDVKNAVFCVKGEEENGFKAADKVTVAMTDKGYVDMVISVAPKSDNYTGNLTIEYRLYSTDITKAKIDRNSKAVFVYDRKTQEFVGQSGLELTLNGKVLWMLGGEYEGAEGMIIADETNAQYKVVEIKNSWVLPGTATAEIVGMNEFGGTKKITFSIKKNSEAVSALDDRIHYFERTAGGSISGSDSADLMLYTAKPIVLF